MLYSASTPEFYLLRDRQQYCPGRITVPDIEPPLGAICVNHHYYSFLKAVTDPNTVLSLALHLHERGQDVVVTIAAKGYVFWGLEPHASPVTGLMEASEMALPCKIVSFAQHRLAQGLAPVQDALGRTCWQFGAEFYSICQVEPDAAKMLDRAARLIKAQQGAAIAITPAGYAVLLRQDQSTAIAS